MDSQHRHSGQSGLRRSFGIFLLGFAATVGAQAPAETRPQSTTAAAEASALLQQTFEFNVPAQKVSTAIIDIARQANVQALMVGNVLDDYQAEGLQQELSLAEALDRMLVGTPYAYRQTGRNAIMVGLPDALVAEPDDPKAPAVPVGNATGAAAELQAPIADIDSARRAGVEEIIVTAQKKEERLLDVPIAMTALSAETLDAFKIEGGSELLRAIPNVNFSKSNFSMYNFSIRGVGTKAISASSDPAVAVSFNNTPLIRNRLFEAEFFDMARVEVLRGPQGTLYGRNATAGVVNLIPALPDSVLGGELKAEVGNYNTRRLSGMFNLPLGDTFGVRAAGAWTQRDGFDYNTHTQQDVNGRDLWSGRLSAAFEPNERFSANLIWQHFEEDDNRSRTGKQLCRRDPGVYQVGTGTTTNPSVAAKMSQGCLPGSLYDDEAYGVPNGLALAYFDAASGVTLGLHPTTFKEVTMVKPGDPYAGVVQSRNLREIATSYDPVFEATNDVVQINLEFGVSEDLKLVSQTAYARDDYYSSQDYNRFITQPVFNDSLQPLTDVLRNPIDPEVFPGATPGGFFCDPQLGCSDRVLSVDISQSKNNQWMQELRLQSAFDGPLNFNLGANYLRFESQDDYYVFNNFFTIIAQYFYGDTNDDPAVVIPRYCPLGYEDRECIYVDPNPIGSLNNQGHNYFLSQNGIETTSRSIFGELYWNIVSDLKLTAGLRYTHDRKISSQVPTQLMLAGGTNGTTIPGSATGGRVNSGYPAQPDIDQRWEAVTGRLVLDWKPNLGLTDDTLVYVSLARGYKGGGTNPPRVDINPAMVQYQPLEGTFKPEYVNAFEIGTKNSLSGGKFMLNATSFVYDYTDYQVSQIVDRIAFNENFNAISWGMELETVWRPIRAVRVDANVGYLRTRIADGESSIDVMDRTQGNEDWMVVRPWLQSPSNCVAPKALVERVLNGMEVFHWFGLFGFCPGSNRVGDYIPETAGGLPLHSFFGFTYDPMRPYNPDTVGLDIADGGSGAPNFARGFAADLGGNELPNAPRWTANLGAQYTFDIQSWHLTLRGDYYWQDDSYARVYNTEYDRLKAWDNANVSVTLDQPRLGLTFQAYVKNAFDDTPITDFFTNSDDTGLTTNVFTLDPRLFGISVRKTF